MQQTGHSARWSRYFTLTLLLTVVCLSTGVMQDISRIRRPATTVMTDTESASRSGALPLAFEANTGLADAGIRYLAHGKGVSLALAADALTFAVGGYSAAALTAKDGMSEAERGTAPVTLRFAFAGANPTPVIAAEEPLVGVANYQIGNDPTRWHLNVPTSARVRYTDLYPGIDLAVYGAGGGGFEYDAIVSPGANPVVFALAISGADAVALDAGTGELVLTVAEGTVRQHAPVIYQERDGARVPVRGGYDLRGDGTVGFSIGSYDPTLPLVIDPQVVPAFSTFLGGKKADAGMGIALDSGGNMYISGWTQSTDFPVTNSSTLGGAIYNAFVTKLNASGGIAYSTYLGGNFIDRAGGIAVDGGGNAYVTGVTRSTNFPVTNMTTLTGYENAFVTKLNASGGIAYSTYLGGTGSDAGSSIAVDSGGNAYITGGTSSTNFPVTNGSTYGGTGDSFVTKMNASGGIAYGTYLGGEGSDQAGSITLDGSGNAYIAGYTTSLHFPVTNGSTYGGGLADVFVTKLDASGTRVFGTYLGGSGDDRGFGIAVDSGGSTYLTGSTKSANFPVTNGSTFGGSQNAFVTKLNAGGVRVYSTYLGGNSVDLGYGIAADSGGNAYVTGETGSADFPVTNGSTFGGGGYDAFVTILMTAPPTPAALPTPHPTAAPSIGGPNAQPSWRPTGAPAVATPLPLPVSRP